MRKEAMNLFTPEEIREMEQADMEIGDDICCTEEERLLSGELDTEAKRQTCRQDRGCVDTEEQAKHEARKASCRAYYWEHKEELAEKHRAYRDEHRQEINEGAKAYYKRNRQKVLDYHKQYYAERKEEISRKAKERRNGIRKCESAG